MSKTKSRKSASSGRSLRSNQEGAGDERDDHDLREDQVAELKDPDEGPVAGNDVTPVAGIGASAGGLDALRDLFELLPEDSGVAFVVVMHLSPEHESHLGELLQPKLKIPVEQVTHEVELEPNRVYVIPPNANLESIDTHLRLSKLEERARGRAPIDHFFRTLADTHGGSAIGVILSGTGSDGTLGLRRIKEQGGLTIVQDPSEAQFDGMPQSAINAAPVDLVLPVAEIPAAIWRFTTTRPRLQLPAEDDAPGEQIPDILQKVFSILQARTGRDFAHYKRATMLRRIARRMQFKQLEDPKRYLELLRDQPQEAEALADDLLITVTSFFRDPEVFAALEANVVPKLFEDKGPDDSVRVWSMGCATGEEAYSLAILLLEEAARREKAPSIQVFASDLHPESLAKAREGVYPGDIEADVGRERLGRFFEKENGNYRVQRNVREAVMFAPHNLLADPPFSRLDLISCRNVIIYLHRDLHPRLAELFHYALRSEGFLLVGASEHIEHPDLFRVQNKKTSIYRRRNVPGPEPRLPVFPHAYARVPASGGHVDRSSSEPLAYGNLHQNLVEQYGPPSVLISPDNNVVHSSAHAGRYLVHPGGPPTQSVFKLVREELRTPLRSAIPVARSERRPVRTDPVTVQCEGERASVTLDLRPALETDQEGFLALFFDEKPLERPTASEPPREHRETAPAPEEGHTSSELQKLEREKQRTEQRLQRLIEEYETSQEEIRASNEELQSANEELRSTLEELETSKEELQSMNEELQTVNQENRHKVEELDRLSSDLQNLLVATDIATLFLDREYRILRFTPKIERLFNIQATDRGRALSDFTTRLGYDGLEEDARQVLEELVPVEREAQDESGCWYLIRILPYRDLQDRIAGVVVTFVDITKLKRAEQEVLDAKETSERIIESLPEPLLVLTPELNVHSANEAFYEHFQVEPRETKGRKVYDLGDGQWNIPSLRELLERVLPENEAFKGYQVDHVFENLGHRAMLLNGRRLDSLRLILLGIHDITDRHGSEQALRENEKRFRAIVNASSQVLYRMSPDWREMRQLHGRGFLTDTKVPSETWLEQYIPAEERDRVEAALEEAVRAKSVLELEHRVRRLDGSVGWTVSRAVPILDDDGEITEWFGAASDVTERREAEEQLREADRRKDEYLAMLGHELRNPLGAMRSATDLLRRAGPKDGPAREAYDVLQRQAGHMTTIIDGLLDVSRVARGKIRVDLEPIDLRDVVSQVVDVRREQINARGLSLQEDIAPEPLWIWGDEARLAQVFDNLVGNAIKFTEPPGTLTVSVQRDDASAVVRVRDTGMGIRPEILSQIFVAFQQETQDIARSKGGLGLGLSLAKGLVDLHHGTLEAHSGGRGEGSEFVVRLPLTEPPSRPASEGEPEDGPAARRILLVEDNVDAAQMLRDLLELFGHEVTVEETAPAALDALQKRRAEVVLCDVGLPGMSGHELARAIRNDPTLRDIPLIALTGYGQAKDRARTAEAGFDEHLTKPVDVQDLNAVLKRLSDSR